MTKVRAPVTIENTLYMLLGELTIERAAAITLRSASYLRSLTDPDKRERLTIDDAISLDLEWRALGRTGYPLLETYMRIVEATADGRFAEEHALGRLTVDFVKESGEAAAALVAAQLPGADVQTLETALRELEHADTATAPAIAHLQKRIRRVRDGPKVHPPDG